MTREAWRGSPHGRKMSSGDSTPIPQADQVISPAAFPGPRKLPDGTDEVRVAIEIFTMVNKTAPESQIRSFEFLGVRPGSLVG